jgi:glycerophosphoryl diester phosphodiesterase
LGKKINVWTIDDPDIAKKLVSLDVDGLITDQPDEILK